MLMGQINPHFFFNSLNSLSMLVREQDNDRALEYIDQLSYTFRYIIQNGQSGMTTLSEEMEFAEAYAYLFKIRYEDKLFFDIDIAEEYMSWTLPALSLQPLIGNAVKHNTITSKNPMRVVIRVVDGVLEVENKKSQKLDTEPSTGIGLKNLRSRWQIVASRDIEVIDEAERFLVRLPLQR
jgi:LytS/YehU family sensor histidine kinase